MRYGVGNLVVATVPLVLWLLADYLYVRGGQDPTSPLQSSLLQVLILGAVPVGLGYINWPLCQRESGLATVGLTILLVAGLSAAWFFLALTVVINFHLWLGGSL